MTKEQFTAYAAAQGFAWDRFGHMQKQVNGKTYRMKLSSIAARFEVKCSAGWVRLRSNYYSKLSVTPDGRLEGMVY